MILFTRNEVFSQSSPTPTRLRHNLSQPSVLRESSFIEVVGLQEWSCCGITRRIKLWDYKKDLVVGLQEWSSCGITRMIMLCDYKNDQVVGLQEWSSCWITRMNKLLVKLVIVLFFWIKNIKPYHNLFFYLVEI